MDPKKNVAWTCQIAATGSKQNPLLGFCEYGSEL